MITNFNFPESADPELIDRLQKSLLDFEKLRVGYVDPSLSEEEKQEVKHELEKEVIKNMKKNKKSFLQKFFFSDYE